MNKLLVKIQTALLRARLARVSADIEQIEHFRATSQDHLDKLLRVAANLRADIWFAQNPRPAVGTTLTSLNAPIRVKGELRRINAKRSCG
jgi:hypothetical protein